MLRHLHSWCLSTWKPCVYVFYRNKRAKILITIKILRNYHITTLCYKIYSMYSCLCTFGIDSLFINILEFLFRRFCVILCIHVLLSSFSNNVSLRKGQITLNSCSCMGLVGLDSWIRLTSYDKRSYQKK